MKSKYVKIAYTPDSDDAFYYYALETGKLSIPGVIPEFVCQTIHQLNEATKSETYEVSAISSVMYPQIADRYAILSVGTSVGRGYGPVLVGRANEELGDLSGKRVGIGGENTTGAFLLRRFYPKAIPLVLPFDRIADATVEGILDAGVMIHEELLYYPKLGLKCILDLGAEWCQRNQLPLPVGLNVARRSLGRATLEKLTFNLRESLKYALNHRDEAIQWVSSYGRGREGEVTVPFVEMFANQDSLMMPQDVRESLRVLFHEMIDLGLLRDMPELDIVDGTFHPLGSRGLLEAGKF